MATATTQFDYRDVVADLTRRIEELTTARNALQHMLIADGAVKEVLVPAASPKPATIEIDVVWPDSLNRKPPVKAVKKAGRPPKTAKAHAESERTVVLAPEPDDVDSPLSVNQAIYRALTVEQLTSRQLKAKVNELRPGTTPGTIDSAVHYLRSKSYLAKNFNTGAFYLTDQRMQNGTQA